MTHNSQNHNNYRDTRDITNYCAKPRDAVTCGNEQKIRKRAMVQLTIKQLNIPTQNRLCPFNMPVTGVLLLSYRRADLSETPVDRSHTAFRQESGIRQL